MVIIAITEEKRMEVLRCMEGVLDEEIAKGILTAKNVEMLLAKNREKFCIGVSAAINANSGTHRV